jgi:hypothetical protein
VKTGRLEALREPLTQGAAFRPRLREVFTATRLFDQATFGLEQKLKTGDGFDRAASKDKGRVVYGT